MGLRSSSLSNAMAESRIVFNLLRRTVADSSDEVLVVVLAGRTEGKSALEDGLEDKASACSMLLLKVLVLVLVLCICDGGFMMVVDKCFLECSL
jgi:hypothetical protein